MDTQALVVLDSSVSQCNIILVKGHLRSIGQGEGTITIGIGGSITLNKPSLTFQMQIQVSAILAVQHHFVVQLIHNLGIIQVGQVLNIGSVGALTGRLIGLLDLRQFDSIGFGIDNHIAGNIGNRHGGTVPYRGSDILATHGDLDLIGSTGQGNAVSTAQHSVNGVVLLDADEVVSNVVNRGVLAQHCIDNSLGHQVHTGLVGVDLLVSDVLIEGSNVRGDATILQIYHAAAVLGSNGLDGCIKLSGLSDIATTGHQSHAEDFRIGIALLHLMQHDGIGLTGGGGSCISKIAIAIVLDQSGIIHSFRSTQGAGEIAKVIGSHEDENDIRSDTGLIIVQVHATVTVTDGVCTNILLVRSGVHNAGTAPGVINQQFHSQDVQGLLPPGIGLGKTAVATIVVETFVYTNGGVIRGIAGNTGISRDTVAQNGHFLALVGGNFLRLCHRCGNNGQDQHHHQQKRKNFANVFLHGLTSFLCENTKTIYHQIPIIASIFPLTGKILFSIMDSNREPKHGIWPEITSFRRK